MKKLLFCLILFLPVQFIQAQDYHLYWKYKDYDGAISVSVPGYLVDIASWFVEEKTERKALRHINKVRALVFAEDNPSPVTALDLQKFKRKATRRHLDELLTIRDGKTHVQIWGKERRSVLRKLVVLVQSPEEFVFLSIKGRIRIQDLTKMMDKVQKEHKEHPEKMDMIRIPVKKV